MDKHFYQCLRNKTGTACHQSFGVSWCYTLKTKLVLKTKSGLYCLSCIWTTFYTFKNYNYHMQECGKRAQREGCVCTPFWQFLCPFALHPMRPPSCLKGSTALLVLYWTVINSLQFSNILLVSVIIFNIHKCFNFYVQKSLE